MKPYLTLALVLGCGVLSYEQTNTFPSSGNVGIGTTTSLNPYGFVSDLTISAGTSGNVDAGLTLRGFRTSNDPFSGIMGYHGSNRVGTIFFNRDNADNSGAISFSTANSGANSERMRISSSGNVGIGTSNPTSKLAIQMPGTETGSGFKILGSYASQPIIEFTEEAYDGFVHIRSGAGASVSRLSGYTDSTTYFMSNVGIGTSNPQNYKLAVNGSMIAESVKVKLHGSWPDYVFEPSYKLLDLKDTEIFIKENKHLPGIPSAKEAEKDGINLGEMNAKLLQKIEELTLYLIELNKTVQNQQKEINQLKSKP